MNRRRPGVRRKRGGWQAFINIDGRFRQQQFPLQTPMAEMQAWRERQRLDAHTAGTPTRRDLILAIRIAIDALPLADLQALHDTLCKVTR